MSVYLPQYLRKVFAVRIAMRPTMMTMSGAQTSNVTAVGILIGAMTANNVSGARIAKPSCGRNSSKKLCTWSTPSPASCTTSDVRVCCAYDGPSESIFLYSVERRPSLTRSAAKVPSFVASLCATKRTAAMTTNTATAVQTSAATRALPPA